MFESIINFFKRAGKRELIEEKSKNTAKERLHLVLMQDRANVSADFLDMMKQEIIEVIKKYIDVDEKEIDVRLTNKPNEDGTVGAPALYANIPIAGIKENTNSIKKEQKEEIKQDEKNVENIENEDKKDYKDEEIEKEANEETEKNIENDEEIESKDNNQTNEEKQEDNQDLKEQENIEKEESEEKTDKKEEEKIAK